MSKAVLILIIVVVLAAIIWGIWVLVSSNTNTPGTNNENPSNNGNNMDIQGMKIEILKEGSGPAAKNNDRVTVHYTGTLTDGTKFDSSVDRNAPYSFSLGNGIVIPGWDLGVVGMKAGEKRKLTIPPTLAYGSAGFGPIPPESTLIFEIELLQIN